MNTATIDYDSLAKQSGAVGATPNTSAGGVDYDALAKQSGAVGATPAATAQPPSSEPAWWDIPGHQIEVAKGGVKGAMRSAAGALDIYATTPTVAGMTSPAPAAQEAAGRTAAWLMKHAHLNNADQQGGNIFETLSEPLLTGSLGEVLEGAEAAGQLPKVAEEAPKASEQLAQMTKRAKAFEDDPRLHDLVRRGIDAVKSTAPYRIAAATVKGGAQVAPRAAVEQAGQTYLKTGGDPVAAGESGLIGAATGGLLGAGFGGAAQSARELATAIENATPGTLELLGAKFPMIRKQLLRLNVEQLASRGKPDPATQAVDQAQGHLGRTAVANSANRTNGLMPQDMTAPLSRQLPAPEGAPAGGFTVGPGEQPVSTPEGELLPPARKKHLGTRVVAGKGSATTPDCSDLHTSAKYLRDRSKAKRQRRFPALRHALLPRHQRRKRSHTKSRYSSTSPAPSREAERRDQMS